MEEREQSQTDRFKKYLLESMDHPSVKSDEVFMKWHAAPDRTDYTPEEIKKSFTKLKYYLFHSELDNESFFEDIRNPDFQAWSKIVIQGSVTPPPVSNLSDDSSDSIPSYEKRQLSWPRIWDLAQYFLPKKIRERVYEPAHQEMLEDYLESQEKCDTLLSKQWINLCFIFRGTILLLDCWRALLTDKSVQLLLSLVPSQIREWWTSLRF